MSGSSRCNFIGKDKFRAMAPPFCQQWDNPDSIEIIYHFSNRREMYPCRRKQFLPRVTSESSSGINKVRTNIDVIGALVINHIVGRKGQDLLFENSGNIL